jgi:hypothetical protein
MHQNRVEHDMNSSIHNEQRGNYDHTLTQQERSLVKTLGMYKGFGKPMLDDDEVREK